MKDPLFSQQYEKGILSWLKGLACKNDFSQHSFGYQISPLRETLWGDYQEPSLDAIFARQRRIDSADPSAIRICLFGSFFRGLYVLNELLKMEHSSGSKAVVTALCTDNPEDEGAKISLKKRLWQYVPPSDRLKFVQSIKGMALSHGIPVYTGQIKSALFKNELLPNRFNPDVILSSTFGQQIDRDIFAWPRYGCFNFHPSDLSKGKYPGGNPFAAMLKEGESHTVMTVHRVDEGLDTGESVGHSIDLCIDFQKPRAWTLDQKILMCHIRTSTVAGFMANKLVTELWENKGVISKIDFGSHLEAVLPTQVIRLLQSPIPGKPKDYRNI